ncbi:hypothetical protein GOP47_0001694 [Adiantum capillus-veneris]|uniref:Uncharacterized protein n=1 Tax=Adiantum capillus-veneris TaxID=13818 RepID=A0A9D4VA19_ADICA|nr:hypothetical protein GOP47_0001694 [Adiantum capillus-veneris]
MKALNQLMDILHLKLSLITYLLVIACLWSILAQQLGAAIWSTNHEVYVVYMGHHGDVHKDIVVNSHHELLSSVKESHEEAAMSMIYHYKHGFSGFSAMLTAQEAAALSSRREVVSVFPSRQKSLHTTRSWEFLGIEDTLSSQAMNFDHNMRNASNKNRTLRELANYGQNIVIGVLDSGVWPESESFSDHGMEPVPPSWKGVCQTGDAFNLSHCNRKLVGARMYIKGYEARFGPLNVSGTGEYRSVRDKDGHGTHTASTAAGREVAHAAAFGGFGAGTASGGAALARLAIYKVCWPLPGESPTGDNTCGDADMLAAFDDAIADGVNVLSVSIGSGNPQPEYFEDSIAIGGLHAYRHGILLSCSAGNAGPKPGSVSNVPPWLLTIAASSVDRTFSAPIELGNGQILEGQAVTPSVLRPSFYPLVHAADCLLSNSSIDATSPEASQCLANSLDPVKTKGKIVLCMRGVNARVEKGWEVLRAGGSGMILANLPSNGAEISVDAHMLPATAVPSDIGEEIIAYMRTTRVPKAKLVPPHTYLGVKPSPFIAAFSSQGPNSVTPFVLKPDISAPGLNILAAWSGDNGPTKLEFDKRRVKYNIYSGTSMSCPHVSGIAALLKEIHPMWSAAAIKSAIMTTASSVGSDGKVIRAASGEVATPFLMGAGEMNPTLAADPGLVYDIELNEFCDFLHSVGYNHTLINIIIGSYPPCQKLHRVKTSDLNLPSVAVDLSTFPAIRVSRKVKNVGIGRSFYTASVKAPSGIKVEVEPSRLTFSHYGQSRRFWVKLALSEERTHVHDPYAFGSLTWSDGLGHNVRSPIVVQTK